MIGQTWVLLKESVTSFLEDEALTRGAAIAFYTVTSIGPVLFIVVAIAGIVFGEEAASGAMSAQLGGLMARASYRARWLPSLASSYS
jgi:membrane protein